MARLIRSFEWGTVEGGFAVVDGVFREIHPWRSRDGVTFVSSHGAVVTSDHRLPYDTPLRFLAPMERADRKEAGLLKEDLIVASETLFAMVDLEHGHYAPFDKQTGLFRTFATLRSEAEIIAFANRFGPLGADLSTAIVHVEAEEPLKMGTFLYWAEPIEHWLAEAADMASVVSLWDLIQAGDRAVFTAQLTRETARLRIKTGAPDGKHLEQNWVLAKKADNPDRFQEVANTGEQDWPLLLLAQWINRGTQGRTDLGLGLSAEKGLSSTLMPKGLIGALWQQASLSIDGHVDFLKCRECSDWFGISAEEARPDKRFCSNACRMRAYRKRKKDSKAKGPGSRKKRGST